MSSIITSRVNLMVSNMDKAINFYQSILGFELLDQYGEHYAEIQAPDLLIGLHPASSKTKYGNNASIGLGVKEFDEKIVELENKGVSFKLENDGWIRLAYFADPDGNQLFLAERE